MRILFCGFCCATLLFALSLGAVHAQDRISEKVGSRVRSVVTSRGEARVVVALEEPPSLRKETVQTSAVRRQVQRLQTDVLSAVSSSEFRVTHAYDAVPALAGALMSEAALERLAEHPKVRRVDLDVGGKGSLRRSVQIVRADRWHEENVTGLGTVVAVLDSGVDTDHDALSDDLIHEACFLNVDGVGQCPNGEIRQFGQGAAEDDHGHGTNVTGIITSDGNRAPKGVAPDAEVVAIKVLNANNRFAHFAEIVDALDYLINNPDLGVQVLNMSLGTNRQFGGECDGATSFNMAGASAVNTLRSQGVVPVASSMNQGSGSEMGSPACLSGVISVGATDDTDRTAEFSNANSFLDLVAPGVGIQSTGLGNTTSTFSGTSQAAPHAAGCAALLLAAETDSTPAAIESSLEASPVRVTDPTSGLRFPRLDCYTAGASAVVRAVAAGPVAGTGDDAPTAPFVLRWQTIRERDSEGFLVERHAGSLPPPVRRSDVDWTKVGFVETKASGAQSSDTLRYQVRGDVPTPGQYVFRLRHLTHGDSTGRQTLVGTTTLDVPIGGQFSLGGPQPNPSRGTATVELVVDEGQDIRIALYDALGRRVRVLYDAFLKAKQPLQVQMGSVQIASGTYFVRVIGERFAGTRKMVIVR